MVFRLTCNAVFIDTAGYIFVIFILTHAGAIVDGLGRHAPADSLLGGFGLAVALGFYGLRTALAGRPIFSKVFGPLDGS